MNMRMNVRMNICEYEYVNMDKNMDIYEYAYMDICKYIYQNHPHDSHHDRHTML